MDGPPRVEHHRRDERELDPRVHQELRDPGRVEDLHGHHGDEHGKRQDRAHDNAAGQIVDLCSPLHGLGVLGLRRPRLEALLHSITGGLHGFAHVLDIDLRGVEVHGDALGAVVRRHVLDPGQQLEHAFDPVDFRGTPGERARQEGQNRNGKEGTVVPSFPRSRGPESVAADAPAWTEAYRKPRR